MKHQTVWRVRVPIDDRTHRLPAGRIVHVDQRHPTVPGVEAVVEVWVEVVLDGGEPIGSAAEVQVFGTGHPIPLGAQHHGSVLDGPFVWHLYQLNYHRDLQDRLRREWPTLAQALYPEGS